MSYGPSLEVDPCYLNLHLTYIFNPLCRAFGFACLSGLCSDTSTGTADMRLKQFTTGEAGACFGTGEEWAETSMDTRWQWICNYNSLVQSEALVEWNLTAASNILRAKVFVYLAGGWQSSWFLWGACFLFSVSAEEFRCWVKAIQHHRTAAMLVSAIVFVEW